MSSSKPSSKPSSRPSSSRHRRQRKQRDFHPPPLFWEKLSRLWLTKCSLREVNRRNRLPPQQPSAPGTFALDFLSTCTPRRLQEIRRFSRRGGPDLSAIRHYPAPSDFEEESTIPITFRTPATPLKNTEAMSKKVTVYDRNFEDHVIEHGVYMPLSKYPDGTESSDPENLPEIRERLRAPRPDWSSGSLKQEFRDFCRLENKTKVELFVIKHILPVLEGDQKADFQTGSGHEFHRLAPLTDGTLVNAMPDFYHGALPSQLKLAARKQLDNLIIPTTKSHRPIAPNFFVEVKGHDGSFADARRQACYLGALGARGIHALQQFGNGNSATTTTAPAYYDNHAYTITCNYYSGYLSLYATHPTKTKSSDNGHDADYVMTPLGKWALERDPETFQQGINAYWNARDLAKEHRDRFIEQANERCKSIANEEE